MNDRNAKQLVNVMKSSLVLFVPSDLSACSLTARVVTILDLTLSDFCENINISWLV